MKIAAIICEYNPFHPGHAYQIDFCKQKGADYVVCLMSGNFTQRGSTAVFDKYERASLSLHGGADAVFELPCCFALSGADNFAKGAVSVLNALGCIDFLCFGCESENFSQLQKACDILSGKASQIEISKIAAQGISYPAAREIFLNKFDIPKCICEMPNNILALEYMLAIQKTNSRISPLPLKREGADYHSKEVYDGYPSATAIRNEIFSGRDILKYYPKNMHESLISLLKNNRPVCDDDFLSLILFKILNMSTEEIAQIEGVAGGLEHKIKKCAHNFSKKSFEDFVLLVKSKKFTYTRIARTLYCILLGIKKEDISFEMTSLYTKLLGFKKASSPLIRKIAQNSAVPVITKPCEYPQNNKMFNSDLMGGDIYDLISKNKTNSNYKQKLTVI